MELVFLALLIVLMVGALMSGFPVGFALPGSAIAAIALAALCGWLFAGDVDAYFAHGGPVEWLSAGVTNFRSLYWEVERDTLIAIPLFVFMGIMLQRSRIAEDLLVAMAQLFGPIPGGLGISVVFVGALLAATTGIVGATVIAMGLISLPAMLRNNYSKPLATGTICASGTLGQIIPPSVVLIILADQLASAADIASTTRKAEYREATGEVTMPSEFDVVSASAGDMFMGAFIPGLILVAIYMLYILGQAILRPKTAPPVPYEGRYDLRFAARVLLALVPPLTLIFAVLGSIITGIATVNQAGAIGAIGALIMGGYRLTAGQRNAFAPAIIAVLSLIVLLAVLSVHDINIKHVTGPEDVRGIVLASIGTAGLLVAIAWSLWRAYRIDDTLRSVMIETTKTTSMVFIILLGAAMLTSAFRAFGGEELVREHLTSLPGGFWTQFVVVMAVIFFLGFFLDFIEIAVVVVPIVAPILLADPSANITAVWLGVMIGINIQTSFLTPPFGFALFYLRGVAPGGREDPADLSRRGGVHRPAAHRSRHRRGAPEPGQLPAEPRVPWLGDRAAADEPQAPALPRGVRLRPLRRERRRASRPHRPGRGARRGLPARRPSREVRAQRRARARGHGLGASGARGGRADRGISAGVLAAACRGAAQAVRSAQAPDPPRDAGAGSFATRPRRDRGRRGARSGGAGAGRGRGGDDRDRGQHPGGAGRRRGRVTWSCRTGSGRRVASIGRASTRRTGPSPTCGR